MNQQTNVRTATLMPFSADTLAILGEKLRVCATASMADGGGSMPSQDYVPIAVAGLTTVTDVGDSILLHDNQQSKKTGTDDAALAVDRLLRAHTVDGSDAKIVVNFNAGSADGIELDYSWLVNLLMPGLRVEVTRDTTRLSRPGRFHTVNRRTCSSEEGAGGGCALFAGLNLASMLKRATMMSRNISDVAQSFQGRR